MIKAFPTCVRCHGSHSELNASGKCVVCHAQELQQTYESMETRPSSLPDHVRPTRTGNPDVASRDPDDRPWQPGDPAPSYLQLAGYGPMTYLAKGGMGFVFVAEYKSLRRRCAIKMMNPIASLDPRQKHRFETEAKALARLQHPGIVQVFDFGRHNEIGYLSLELVTGGSLARRLTETPALTYTQIADLAKQVASAVAAAHALGILHRDLKPANILLDHLGRAKVTDFGLASLHDASVNLTETGAMIGTPAYMSPEQAAGQFHLVSERSDVYAIGATLYEMITGSPPFKAESAVATASRVIHDVPVPPRSIARDCPRDLETICLRCLEKDPARRYATAADLANELSRFLRGEPVERPSWAQRARKTLRKYRVAASVLLCLAFGGAGYLALIPDEPQVAMAKRIKRGLPVTLVGERGKPAYAIDRLGISNLGIRDQSSAGDGAATIRTNEEALLELCPDTLTDNFIIEAELLHADYLGTNTPALSRIGLYLRTHSPDVLFRRLVFSLQDYVPNPMLVKNGSFKPVPNTARFLDLFEAHTPNQISGNNHQLSPTIEIARREAEAVYRRVRLSVIQGTVETSLECQQNDRMVWKIIGSTTLDEMNGPRELASNMHHLQQFLPDLVQKPIPLANPPFSFGIFCQKAVLAFRNITLTPLPRNP